MWHRQCPAGTWEVARQLPHPALRPGVLQYRGFRMDLGGPRRRLELPSGSITIVFNFGERLHVTCASSGRVLASSSAPVVAGMLTRPSIGEHSGRLYGMEVALQPWAAFRLFDTPLREIADAMAPAAPILGARGQLLSDALADAPGWPERFALLDTALRHWTDTGAVPCARTIHAWEQLRASGGTMPVRELATLTGWGERHLERRFLEQIGLTPKGTARVLRLRRALALMADGTSPADVAMGCRFYDQAHFNREFKAMTGQAPLRFMALRALTRSGPPAVDRLEGELTSAVLDA
ncbi:helix-turn-helix transcriptional regulator [Streptomyces sp. NPDC006733]|uniref:helix-turn-helix transcriptional regulator n=1 Tax=Streptomyces sp. NPDC006733 TaxID=3155460 RepID=UPI0033FCADAE